jgi:hypothetical protein
MRSRIRSASEEQQQQVAQNTNENMLEKVDYCFMGYFVALTHTLSLCLQLVCCLRVRSVDLKMNLIL